MQVQVFTLESADADNTTETLYGVYASLDAALEDATKFATNVLEDCYSADDDGPFNLRTYITDDFTLIAIIRPARGYEVNDGDDCENVFFVEWWRVRGQSLKGAEDMTKKLMSMI